MFHSDELTRVDVTFMQQVIFCKKYVSFPPNKLNSHSFRRSFMKNFILSASLLLAFQTIGFAAEPMRCSTETLSMNQKNGQWFGLTNPATLGTVIAGAPRQFVDERGGKFGRRSDGITWDYSLKQVGENLEMNLSMVTESDGTNIKYERTVSVKDALETEGVAIAMEEVGGPISTGKWDSQAWIDHEIEALNARIKEVKEKIKASENREEKKGLKSLLKELGLQLKAKKKEPIAKFETFIIKMYIKCHQF